MTRFDKNRIENAIWLLMQYEDELVNIANEMKLMDYEVKNTFDNLRQIRGYAEKEDVVITNTEIGIPVITPHGIKNLYPSYISDNHPLRLTNRTNTIKE